MEACCLLFVSWCLLIFQSTWLLFMMEGVPLNASGQDRSELVLAAEVSTRCSNNKKPFFLLSLLIFYFHAAVSSFLFLLSKFKWLSMFPLLFLGLCKEIVIMQSVLSTLVFNTQHTFLSNTTSNTHRKPCLQNMFPV